MDSSKERQQSRSTEVATYCSFSHQKKENIHLHSNCT